MQIVHFGHACLLVETGSARVLIDPGTFASGFESLRELDYVLVTHQHHDHLDLDRLPALLAANPDAEIIADVDSARELTDRGVEVTAAEPGFATSVKGVRIEAFGGLHAQAHPDLPPPVPNIAFMVDGLLHPGDSLDLPDGRDVDVLALPTGAPWLKTSEAIDYLRAVKPRVAVPIHEATLAMPELCYRLFDHLKPEGSTVTVVPRGEPTRV